MATLAQYLDYYQGRMAYQYANLPRASAHIRNFVAQAVASNFLETLEGAFDINTAVGPQLDIIGKYIGANRIVEGTLETPYFGFWRYTQPDPLAQNQNGFYRYSDGPSGLYPAFNVPAGDTETISGTTYFSASTIDGDLIVNGDFIQTQFSYAEFYRYLNASTSTSTLSDGQYRFLLKLKIVINSSDGTLASIQDFLAQFFASQVTVIDNTDMTLSYSVLPAVPLPVDVLRPYLPKPMGVGITINGA